MQRTGRSGYVFRLPLFTILCFGLSSAETPSSIPDVPAARELVPRIEMVDIPGGTFVMGEAGGEFDEHPEHEVTLSPFRMSKYEVTVAQYRAFAEATGRSLPKEPDWGWQDEHPIVNVSWNEAYAFAAWLSERTARRIALPTEAQWSYVARSGGSSRYVSGTDRPGGNVADDTGKSEFGDRRWKGHVDGFLRTAPVGSFPENRFGVHDLDGNVAEWCANWHYTYESRPERDPPGPETGKNKVFRGAAFLSDPWYSRVAQRNFMPTDFEADYLGIRLVELLPGAESEE